MFYRHPSQLVCFAIRSGIAAMVLCLASVPAQAQIGTSMVSFLQGRVNTRVGGGECAQMATEALRVSGGEFVASDLGADYPASGDYVWGTLVTVIAYSGTWSDSNASNACQPGDIIQYRNATFTYSKTSTQTMSHHTSVVAAVDSTKNRPTSVYQQNYNNVRTVQSATIDASKLTAGWIRIYRPIARVVRTNEWKITTVNNSSASQTYKIMVGTSTVSTVTLTAANTSGCFLTQTATTTGTVPCIVLSNNQTLYIQTAKGNEIYNPSGTTIAVRQLTP